MLKQPSMPEIRQPNSISTNKVARRDTPTEVRDNDVLCGRGGLANKHPGNMMFRRVVNQNKDAYHSCKKKSHKYFLAVSIIAAMERQGARFLKKDETTGKWVCISRKDAFAKTSQALREQDGRSKKSIEAVERVMAKKQQAKVEPAVATETAPSPVMKTTTTTTTKVSKPKVPREAEVEIEPLPIDQAQPVQISAEQSFLQEQLQQEQELQRQQLREQQLMQEQMLQRKHMEQQRMLQQQQQLRLRQQRHQRAMRNQLKLEHMQQQQFMQQQQEQQPRTNYFSRSEYAPAMIGNHVHHRRSWSVERSQPFPTFTSPDPFASPLDDVTALPMPSFQRQHSMEITELEMIAAAQPPPLRVSNSDVLHFQLDDGSVGSSHYDGDSSCSDGDESFLAPPPPTFERMRSAELLPQYLDELFPSGSSKGDV